MSEPIFDKSKMSEEDIKFHYITPAITKKWQRAKISMEFTAAKLFSAPKRGGRAANAPITSSFERAHALAVVEAKSNAHSPRWAPTGDGIRTADAPFAYSSNGTRLSNTTSLPDKSANSRSTSSRPKRSSRRATSLKKDFLPTKSASPTKPIMKG